MRAVPVRRRLLGCLLAGAVALCGLPAQAQAPAAAISLPALLKQLADKQQVCAVAVAVVRARKLQAVHTASGCEPPQPVVANSLFQAASLSKPLSVVAAIKTTSPKSYSMPPTVAIRVSSIALRSAVAVDFANA